MKDLSQFSFSFTGYGHYKVTYTTKRGDYYKATITDMETIDNTKNSDNPKQKDIKIVRDMIKRTGTHYSKNGEIIE